MGPGGPGYVPDGVRNGKKNDQRGLVPATPGRQVKGQKAQKMCHVLSIYLGEKKLPDSKG